MIPASLPLKQEAAGKTGNDVDPYVYRSNDGLATWTKFSVQPVSKIFLSPTFAVWSPLMIFAMFGVYLLSKVKT